MTFRHAHKWTFFVPSEDDGTDNWRGVRLPARRVCLTCGITQILVEDLLDYPHVQAAMIANPEKLISVNAA